MNDLNRDKWIAALLTVIAQILLILLLDLLISNSGPRPVQRPQGPFMKLALLNDAPQKYLKDGAVKNMLRPGNNSIPVAVPAPNEALNWTTIDLSAINSRIIRDHLGIEFRNFGPDLVSSAYYSGNDPVQKEIGKYIAQLNTKEPTGGVGDIISTGIGIQFGGKIKDLKVIFDDAVILFKRGYYFACLEKASFVASNTIDGELRERALYRRLMCLFELEDISTLLDDAALFERVYPDSLYGDGVKYFLHAAAER
ncbi:hypothetical protein KAU32_11670 [bacterium]|nr:hypothetical protein [bacterium]